MGAKYQQYDALTGKKLKETKLPEQWYSIFIDGACNPVDGKIYVMGYDGRRVPYLAILDPETGTYVNSWAIHCPVNVASMAFDSDGTLYAITSSGEICTISLETGEGTTLFRVEDEGQNIYYWQTIAFDYHTGELFWIRSSSKFTTDLRRINLDKQNVEIISDLPDFGAVGAWIVSPEAPAKAPNTVPALSAEFSGAATIGNISVTAPSTTFDGEPLSGNLTVKISVDGQQVSSLQVEAGKTATISNHDFATAGEHKVSAIVSNSEGNSPEGTITAYCGVDTPLPVSNVNLQISKEGVANLEWSAPKSGIHAAHFDNSLLRYKVVRFPGNETVAENLSATSFSEQLSNTLTRYHYEVTVSMDGNEGEPIISNEVVYGDGFEIPFNSLLGDNMFEYNTIIDVDGDEQGWYETWGSVSCTTPFHEAGYYSEDWLFTPPIQMAPGNYYIRTSYMYQSETPCDFVITFGDSPEIDAQKQTIASVSPALNDFGLYPIEGYAKVEKEGKYYIGFKVSATSLGYVSTPYISVYNLSVEKGADDNAPAAVADLKASPLPKGELKSTITFTAPTVTYAGKPLSSINKIEICNADDVVLGEITDVTPGQQYTYVDEKATQGYNTYRVFACNSSGRGLHNQVETYVGADIPDMISYLKYEVEDNHKVSFEWGAPSELGIRGGYVDPANIRYNFCRSEVDYVEPFPVDNGSNLQTTNFVWDEQGNWEGDPQYLINYGVKAVNNIGEGPLGYTSIVLGKPVSTPFVESFKSGYLSSSVWRISSITGESAWNLTSGTTSDGILPSDSDGGMVHFLTVSATNTRQALVTPLFELKDMKNPALIFDMYHKKDASDNAYLSVNVSSEDSPYSPVADNIKVKSGQDGWQTHTISLSDYNDKDRLFIAFIGATSGEGASFAIDNIRICDNVDYDLGIDSFTGPSNMLLGDTETFSVRVQSKGVKETSDYTIDIYALGEKVASAKGVTLKLAESADIDIEVSPNAALANKDVEFEARINLDGDDNDSNDSATIVVAMGGTELPAPQNLSYTSNANEVELTWEQPSAPSPVIENESFEDYEAFAIKGQGPWKFYDGDTLYPYGINGLEYPNMDQPRAFMIWAPGNLNFTESPWQPRTGSQCLIAFSSSYQKVNGDIDFNEQSDEWLISPKVVGGTELSFYATSVNNNYVEHFEVMVSSTGRNPEDFTLFGQTSVVTTSGWNKYSYTLPDDTKYFAIRYVSRGYEAFALLIDDIEYTAGYTSANLVGYNLYVNGKRENSEPIHGTQTKVSCNFNRDNLFGISAMYTEGESEMIVIKVLSGVDTTVSNGIVLKVEGNNLVIDNAENMRICLYDTAGRLCGHIDRGCGHDVIPNVAEGIYIVTIGSDSYKIIIEK